MRLAGTLASQHDAATVADYLLTLGIAAKVERSGEQWDMWVFDEDQLPRSREELAAFQADPQAARYREAGKQADALRRAHIEKEIAARRQQLNAPRPMFVSSHGKRPITMALVMACSVLHLLVSESKESRDLTIENQFRITAVQESGTPHVYSYNKTLPEIRAGQVWRTVTPIFLHNDILHLFMNMLGLIYFGTQIEMLQGWKRMLLFVVLFAVPGNVGQFYYSGPLFAGISGVVFGLFGYVWMKSTYEPWSGYVVNSTSVILMLIWFFLGIVSEIVEAAFNVSMINMANICHGGGLLMGVLVGYAPTWLRSFRKQS